MNQNSNFFHVLCFCSTVALISQISEAGTRIPDVIMQIDSNKFNKCEFFGREKKLENLRLARGNLSE